MPQLRQLHGLLVIEALDSISTVLDVADKSGLQCDRDCATWAIYNRALQCDKYAMSTRELIETEIAKLPEPLQREVYDFIRFLKLKQEKKPFNGLLLSESALSKDWNTPEEDAAWANL